MSLLVCCGAECGIAVAGTGTAINRHWSAIAGTTITVDTGTFRNGAKSFKFVGNATAPYLYHTCAASQTYGYYRIYFRVNDATPPSDTILATANQNGGSNFRLTLRATGVLDVSHGGSTGLQASSVSVAADTWYGFECEIDLHANPRVIRWRMWSAAGGWVGQTDSSAALAADTFAIGNGCTNAAMSVFHDDILIGAGTTANQHYSASVPAGSAGVLRYRPNADGTHSAFTTGDFKYNNTTNIVNTATDVYTYLDEDNQTAITDFISQAVAGAGKYVRIAFENEGTLATPRAVGITSAHHSNGTGANEHHLRVSDNGTNWSNVWGDWSAAGDDISDTTLHSRHKVLLTKPSGGAWTQSAVNSLEAEWGNSDDVSAVPYIDSVSLEVDWVESTSEQHSGGFTLDTTTGAVGTGSKAAAGPATSTTSAGTAGTGSKAAAGSAPTQSATTGAVLAGRKGGAGSAPDQAATTGVDVSGRKGAAASISLPTTSAAAATGIHAAAGIASTSSATGASATATKAVGGAAPSQSAATAAAASGQKGAAGTAPTQSVGTGVLAGGGKGGLGVATVSTATDASATGYASLGKSGSFDLPTATGVAAAGLKGAAGAAVAQAATGQMATGIAGRLGVAAASAVTGASTAGAKGAHGAISVQLVTGAEAYGEAGAPNSRYGSFELSTATSALAYALTARMAAVLLTTATGASAGGWAGKAGSAAASCPSEALALGRKGASAAIDVVTLTALVAAAQTGRFGAAAPQSLTAYATATGRKMGRDRGIAHPRTLGSTAPRDSGSAGSRGLGTTSPRSDGATGPRTGE